MAKKHKNLDNIPIKWNGDLDNPPYGAGNKKRLAHHKEAHEVGSWVREAAIAYANKKNNIQKSA